MTFSIEGFLQHSADITINIECHNADCRVIFIAMLDVIRVNVISIKCRGAPKADPRFCAATWRLSLNQ
jgi:hypothetical protein